MALKQTIELRLQQRLVMPPALQMAIQLLQLNRLELENVLQDEMVENPMLEEREEPAESVDVPVPVDEVDTESDEQGYYLVQTYWESEDEFWAWTNSEEFRQAHSKRPPAEMFAGKNVLEIHDVVIDSGPAGGG